MILETDCFSYAFWPKYCTLFLLYSLLQEPIWTMIISHRTKSLKTANPDFRSCRISEVQPVLFRTGIRDAVIPRGSLPPRDTGKTIGAPSSRFSLRSCYSFKAFESYGVAASSRISLWSCERCFFCNYSCLVQGKWVEVCWSCAFYKWVEVC